jgi:hypothetical protein
MADLRHITIPKSINVRVGNALWSFVRSAEHIINTDPRFNATGAGIRAGARLMAKIEIANEGETAVTDQADWKLLHEGFEAPAAGYIPPLMAADEKTGQVTPLNIPGRAFISYIDAVSDESTKSPPKETKSANGVEAKAPAEQAAQA